MKTSSRMTPLQQEAVSTPAVHRTAPRPTEAKKQVLSFTITVRRTLRVLKASFPTLNWNDKSTHTSTHTHWTKQQVWGSDLFQQPKCFCRLVCVCVCARTARSRLPPSHHHVLHVLAIQHSNQHSNHEGRSVTHVHEINTQARLAAETLQQDEIYS